jgi:hypothetical protein
MIWPLLFNIYNTSDFFTSGEPKINFYIFLHLQKPSYMNTRNIGFYYFLEVRCKNIIYTLLLILFTGTVSCTSGNNNIPAGLHHLTKILFVNPSKSATISAEEQNDLKSLKNSIFVAGINFTEKNIQSLDPKDLQDFDIIILPYAVSKNLTDTEINLVKETVNAGRNIVLDGITRFSDELGITLNPEETSVDEIRDLQFPDNLLYWTIPARTKTINNSHKKYHTICIDEKTKLPLAVSGKYGNGNFIYYVTLFDPNTDKGYSRYPYLIETLDQTFGNTMVAERQFSEMYFDPGMRDDSVNIDELARQWRNNKIKRIHAAGWYYDYDYDYKRLINACHTNGILVYCWLEPPMISIGFWKRHPEWREKTAYLKDARIDWRYLINLADENCRKQVCKEWGDFLLKYDWDGVNLAELYFEPSPVGPELPENFTPMNTIVRKEFEEKGGFDPVHLFEPASQHYWKTNHADWKKFAGYRKDLCCKLKAYFLNFLSKIHEKKNNFEVLLTVLDVSLTPELSDNIAEDTQNSLNLYQKYRITMQIEDPSNCWGLTPERYLKMGQFYRKYIREESQLLFDCNVVNSHEKGFGGFPSEKPTGEEIRQIVYNMSISKSRPMFYSEDAINTNDFPNINRVLARDTRITAQASNQWHIVTPYTVSLHTGINNISCKLDDRIWLAGNGDEIIIPSGEHILELGTARPDTNAIRLYRISGELQSAQFLPNEIYLSYKENITSCYVSINKLPGLVFIDNRKVPCTIYKDNRNEFTIKLPPGTHTVKIR